MALVGLRLKTTQLNRGFIEGKGRGWMPRRRPQSGVAGIVVAMLVTVGLGLTACGGTATATATKASTQTPATTTAQATPTGPVTGSVPACPPAGSANALTGAGATFPAPLYTRQYDEYARLCNVKANYQAIGSGGGIKQHAERTVDFGASDGILTDKQKQDAPGTLMIPMTAGAVAIVVNLPGMDSGKLKLSADTLAAIYLGSIRKWNDPKIAADNVGMALPDTAITVVRRADGSGTTNIFTTYLSQISKEWSDKVGKGNSVQWPIGIGGEGNAGVAGQVRQVPGAVGYVELAYAKQTKIPWVALKNQAGKYVEPSLQASTVAMEGVDIPNSTEVMITNSANPEAYPITGLTWILAYKDQNNPAKARSLAYLLWWQLHDGQKFAADLDYAALSAKAIQKAEALLKSINSEGQPIIK